MNAHTFRAGDRVTVRSHEEILATLDAEGTLCGLPFMPEMLQWFGKPLRVQRRAEKTCVAVAPPTYHNRRFSEDDVVFLDGARCDGSGHDGCKRGCNIFWKEAWLRPFEPGDESTGQSSPASRGAPELRARLKTKVDDKHYFCQSTELGSATDAFPGNKKVWRMRIAVRETRNGDRSIVEMIALLLRWIAQKVVRKALGDQWLRGPNERTPVVSLDLKPGEQVRIKSRPEVVATLDHHRTNRGLGICYEMTRLCGGYAEVDGRVDRIINELTGEMREIHNTVTLTQVRSPRTLEPLHGTDCLCANEIGDCPRCELMHWREIWLERVEESRN